MSPVYDGVLTPTTYRDRGVWDYSAAYLANDLVTYEGEPFYCTTPHTGTFLSFDASKWLSLLGGSGGGSRTVYDGGTTPATVQAAIDAASAAGGGVVDAAASLYTLTTPWILPSRVFLRVGGGTIVTQGTNANLPYLLKSTSFETLYQTQTVGGIGYAGLSGGIWDGNKQNNSATTWGIATFGYLLRFADIEVRNCKGKGFFSEWNNVSTLAPGQIIDTPVHNFYDNINCYGCEGGGYHVDGPYDCSHRNINAGFNDTSYTYPNIWIGSKSGAALLDTCHGWSKGSYAMRFDDGSGVQCINCHAEGGFIGNVYWGGGGVWIGGRSFSNVSWADSGDKGFIFGPVAFVVRIDGVAVEGCASGAFDLSSGGGANSIIKAHIDQAAGTTLIVGNPDGITWDLDGIVGTVPPMELMPPASTGQSWRRPVYSDTKHDRYTVFIEEEFLNGTTGEHGWVGTGTVTAAGAEDDAIGIVHVDTGAVSGTVGTVSLGAPSGILKPTTRDYTTEFRFRLNSADANTTARIGFLATAVGDPPTDGIYLEKLNTDTNWFCVVRKAGVQTRVDSGVAATAAWKRVKMRFKWTGAASCAFSIDGATEVLPAATNVPTAPVAPVVQVKNHVASSKTFDIDWFRMTIVGMQR